MNVPSRWYNAAMRLPALAGLTLAVCALLLPGMAAQGGAERSVAKARSRPNIIVLMTDDQTAESVRVMRNTRRLIADQGASLTNFIVSYALCCPSRATFMSGQYAHNHRVLNNEPPFGGFKRFHGKTALPVWLQKGGYHTAHIGKYLNGYGRTRPKQVPPGWDDWHTTIDPSTYRFWNYRMNENGKVVQYGSAMRDYVTDVAARKSVALIRRHAKSAKPLFLTVSFLAPHSGGPVALDDPPRMLTPEPAPRHRDRYVFAPLPQVPSYNEENVRDKPLGVRRRPAIDDLTAVSITENYQQRLESLLAVDEAVAAIVRALRSTGQLDNTYLFFTSDNGYFHGEHRIPSGKVLPYEEALRVPLFVRGPGIQRGRQLDQLTANIDLAPTIAEMARVAPGRIVDGLSLLGLLRTGSWAPKRDGILVEAGPFDKPAQEFAGVRTARFQFTVYGNGEQELYDLAADPSQLENRIGDPEYAHAIGELTQQLERLRWCAGANCRP
jgi:arylsulfatase A-like enzyme